VCGTDLELARGYMDFEGVPGHEFVGVVEEVEGTSAEKALWSGRRVVSEINFACGACAWCGKGLGRHCPHRTVLGIMGRDGAHAGRVTVPIANLHAVPDAVPDLEAVFIEPLAAACEILDQVAVAEADRVLVVGDGRLAQLIARVLRTAASSVTVLGRHPEKLALLADLDIASTIDGTGLKPGFDLVAEATGSPSGIYAAARLVRPRGTIVLKSTFQGERPLPVARLVVDEVTIVGSRCGRFEAAIPLLAARSVRVADLVTETLPLSDAAKAYERSAARGVLKILLEP
jgi:alcohol dehydrogenase